MSYKLRRDIIDVIIRKKSFSFFCFFEDGSYIIKNSSECDKNNMSYAHLVKLIKIFEDKRYLNTIKEGRTRRIYLTEKGKLIQSELKKIWETLEKTKKSLM